MKAAFVVLAALALTGCAAPQDADVRDVAAEFTAALAAADGAGACRLLAPETRSELEEAAGLPCDQAVLDEDLPTGDAAPRDVVVFGTAGRVVTATDTLFLARFEAGWRVVAAGCDPLRVGAERPHECRVEGG